MCQVLSWHVSRNIDKLHLLPGPEKLVIHNSKGEENNLYVKTI